MTYPDPPASTTHFATPTQPPAHTPVQHTEPLPDWLRDELAAGRDKLPELREAICRAILKSKGVLAKSERNQEQGYSYTGMASILESVREAMASEGLSVEQVSADLEEEIHYSSGRGAQTIWKWRVVCLVTHTSGAAVVRVIRPITMPGNKASGIARTSADRLLLTSLMRIAGGGRDEDMQGEQHNDPDARSWRGGGRDAAPRNAQRPSQGPAQVSPPAQQPQQQQPKHRDFTEAELAEAHARAEQLVSDIKTTTTSARLVTWSRIASAHKLPEPERKLVGAAWITRCEELGLKPDDLRRDVKELGPLPFGEVIVDAATGDMHDRRDGTLL